MFAGNYMNFAKHEGHLSICTPILMKCSRNFTKVLSAPEVRALADESCRVTAAVRGALPPAVLTSLRAYDAAAIDAEVKKQIQAF